MYHYKIRSNFHCLKNFKGKKIKIRKVNAVYKTFKANGGKKGEILFIFKQPELKKLLTLGSKQNFAISDINMICSMSALELL